MGQADGIWIRLPGRTRSYRWVALGQVIRNWEDTPGECGIFPESRLHCHRLVPGSGNWRDLPSGLIQNAMGGAYASGGGRAGFFRRLSYAEPSPITAVVSPMQKATMMCHPTKDRPFSIRFLKKRYPQKRKSEDIRHTVYVNRETGKEKDMRKKFEFAAALAICAAAFFGVYVNVVRLCRTLSGKNKDLDGEEDDWDGLDWDEGDDEDGCCGDGCRCSWRSECLGSCADTCH